MIREEIYDRYTRRVLLKYMEYEYSGNKRIREKVFEGKDKPLTCSKFTEYFYDDNGRLVKESLFTYDKNTGAGFPQYSQIYEFDERGNMIKTYQKDDAYGIISGEEIYVYNSENRLIEEEIAEAEADDAKYIKHIYDRDGRESKVEYYNITRNLIRYVDRIYNGASRLSIREVHYSKNNEQIAFYTHHYDEWGNITESVINDECSMFKRQYKGVLKMEEIIYKWQDYKHNTTGQMPEDGMLRYEYKRI
jgi:hypothetical protein